MMTYIANSTKTRRDIMERLDKYRKHIDIAKRIQSN